MLLGEYEVLINMGGYFLGINDENLHNFIIKDGINIFIAKNRGINFCMISFWVGLCFSQLFNDKINEDSFNMTSGGPCWDLVKNTKGNGLEYMRTVTGCLHSCHMICLIDHVSFKVI